MKLRTLALVLALGFGVTTLAEAKTPAQKAYQAQRKSVKQSRKLAKKQAKKYGRYKPRKVKTQKRRTR
jgi:hypothetical protein